jgi:hypothetical protein
LVASRACGSINSASSLFKTPLSRAERTPEVAAVSGVYREGRGELMTLPGIPRTNLSQASTAVLTETPGTPQKLTIHDAIKDYLDCIAQVAIAGTNLGSSAYHPKCGQWFKVGRCKNGHRVAVSANCRKPYCGICSDMEHHKKIARLYPKAQQLLYGAWWVIPPPPGIQIFFHNRRGRRHFIKRVIKALKSLGYRKGILIVHLFGEDKTKFFFHVNVLVDGGWLEPEELDDLKRKLRRMIYPESVVKRWGDKLDIFYEYKTERATAYHALDYFSRPTFTQLEGNERLAKSIKGEKLVRQWGKWDEKPKWHLDDTGKKLQSLVSLEKGKCPVCGEPIEWGKGVVPKALIDLEGSTEIAPGYLLLPMERAPPEGRLDFTNLTELPDGDYRKHPNHIRKEIDRHRELISRRRDRKFAS